MRTHFEDALVRDWEGLEGTYGLPDPDDEHVLAAAVVGGAGSIVTENLRDFAQDKVPAGIEVVNAKSFAFETVALRPDLGLSAVLAMSARSGGKHARKSPADILDSLDRIYRMDSATSLIRLLL